MHIKNFSQYIFEGASVELPFVIDTVRGEEQKLPILPVEIADEVLNLIYNLKSEERDPNYDKSGANTDAASSRTAMTTYRSPKDMGREGKDKEGAVMNTEAFSSGNGKPVTCSNCYRPVAWTHLISIIMPNAIYDALEKEFKEIAKSNKLTMAVESEEQKQLFNKHSSYTKTGCTEIMFYPFEFRGRVAGKKFGF